MVILPEAETYEETTQTITAGGDTVEVGINRSYLKTPPGILKIIEFVSNTVLSKF